MFRPTFSDFEKDPSSSIFCFGFRFDNKFGCKLSYLQNDKINICQIGTL